MQAKASCHEFHPFPPGTVDEEVLEPEAADPLTDSLVPYWSNLDRVAAGLDQQDQPESKKQNEQNENDEEKLKKNTFDFDLFQQILGTISMKSTSPVNY